LFDLNDYDQWDGPPLAGNLLVMPKTLKRVENVALGENHMVAICTNHKGKVIYGMGSNKWGQLAIDPAHLTFVEYMTLIDIEVVAVMSP